MLLAAAMSNAGAAVHIRTTLLDFQSAGDAALATPGCHGAGDGPGPHSRGTTAHRLDGPAGRHRPLPGTGGDRLRGMGADDRVAQHAGHIHQSHPHDDPGGRVAASALLVDEKITPALLAGMALILVGVCEICSPIDWRSIFVAATATDRRQLSRPPTVREGLRPPSSALPSPRTVRGSRLVAWPLADGRSSWDAAA